MSAVVTTRFAALATIRASSSTRDGGSAVLELLGKVGGGVGMGTRLRATVDAVLR